MKLLIVIFVLIIFLIIFNYKNIEHMYTYPKIVINPRLVNKYYAPEVNQAVVLSGNYFYAIGDNMVGKYNKRSGEHILSFKMNLKHINSGTDYNGNIYLVNNFKKNNYYDNKIVIFDLNMNYIKTIYMNHLDNKGSLTWIDRYKGHWYGMLSYYGDEKNKTVLIRFEDDFTIEKVWLLPQEILDKLGKWSISSGIFDTRTGHLLLSGHDKKEIYLTKFDENKKNIMLLKVIKSFNEGQGINFDSTNLDYIWGIQRSNKEIVKMKLYDYYI